MVTNTENEIYPFLWVIVKCFGSWLFLIPVMADRLFFSIMSLLYLDFEPSDLLFYNSLHFLPVNLTFSVCRLTFRNVQKSMVYTRNSKP